MAAAALAVGAEAPAFEIPNQDGSVIRLADYRGRKNVLIYFYPRAGTPGCTKQACNLRDTSNDYEAADTVVLGISTDPVKRLAGFRDKHGLQFDLLSDADHKVAEAYGVWGPRLFLGRVFQGVARSSFVVDKRGVLRHVIPKAKPGSHHQDVLDFVRANSASWD